MKISPATAQEIRRIWRERPTHKSLAAKYGVSPDWIAKLVASVPRRKDLCRT